jgi:hypothetical protein
VFEASEKYHGKQSSPQSWTFWLNSWEMYKPRKTIWVSTFSFLKLSFRGLFHKSNLPIFCHTQLDPSNSEQTLNPHFPFFFSFVGSVAFSLSNKKVGTEELESCWRSHLCKSVPNSATAAISNSYNKLSCFYCEELWFPVLFCLIRIAFPISVFPMTVPYRKSRTKVWIFVNIIIYLCLAKMNN